MVRERGRLVRRRVGRHLRMRDTKRGVWARVFISIIYSRLVVG
jgi:hypothetical protein